MVDDQVGDHRGQRVQLQHEGHGRCSVVLSCPHERWTKDDGEVLGRHQVDGRRGREPMQELEEKEHHGFVRLGKLRHGSLSRGLDFFWVAVAAHHAGDELFVECEGEERLWKLSEVHLEDTSNDVWILNALVQAHVLPLVEARLQSLNLFLVS